MSVGIVIGISWEFSQGRAQPPKKRQRKNANRKRPHCFVCFSIVLNLLGLEFRALQKLSAAPAVMSKTRLVSRRRKATESLDFTCDSSPPYYYGSFGRKKQERNGNLLFFFGSRWINAHTYSTGRATVVSNSSPAKAPLMAISAVWYFVRKQTSPVSRK